MQGDVKANGLELQAKPRIYVTALPGPWLLKRATPSWRIKDPEKGFQRVVKEERAKKIAITVLDQQRTFPNAIVLATDQAAFEKSDGKLTIPTKSRFLVVDGQHRLWAQRFSDFEANYACVVHMGLSEVEMATLFLEINDNQKRVPSSLRWDLVRLVRPDDDPHAITATELIFELSTDKASPFFQRIDLTGEQKELSIKQGSLAPEIKTLVSNRSAGIRRLDFEKQYEVLVNYFTAIKSLDSEGWRAATSPFYKARILRALLRLLPDIAKTLGNKPEEISAAAYRKVLERIKKASLETDAIRAAQGSAGMKEIYDVIRRQLAL